MVTSRPQARARRRYAITARANFPPPQTVISVFLGDGRGKRLRFFLFLHFAQSARRCNKRDERARDKKNKKDNNTAFPFVLRRRRRRLDTVGIWRSFFRAGFPCAYYYDTSWLRRRHAHITRTRCRRRGNVRHDECAIGIIRVVYSSDVRWRARKFATTVGRVCL